MQQGETPDSDLAVRLRQIIAALQEERQAFAAMDLDALLGCTANKQELCKSLEATIKPQLDAECEGLLYSAMELNEVNRRIRNMLAVNVAARLDALTGSSGVYNARQTRRKTSLQSA